MTLYWIYDLPNWLLGVLCIATFVGFGLGGVELTRTVVKRIHEEDHSHNDVVGYYLAALTVFYGITLGLVAVGTWNNYSTVKDKVDREAQNVSSLYRDANSYPEPFRTTLTTVIRQYTREVIDHSWPLQRQGIVPTGSNAYLDRVQNDMLQFNPANVGQQVLHAEAYTQFNELVEARRSRLDSVTTSLPRSLWWMVILGAVFCIVASMFFDMRSIAMHRWMTSLMSGLLGLMIFLVATLDNPFRGKVSVGPDALQNVYEQLMLKGADLPTPPPAALPLAPMLK